MNDLEAKEFFTDVIAVNFPSITAWIDKTSVDPKKTREKWREIFRELDVEEAMWFANQLLIGEIKVHAYEYDQFPAKLRTACLERRGKIRESQRQNTFLAEMQASRNEKKSLISNLGLTHYVFALCEIRNRIWEKPLTDAEKARKYADAEKEVLMCHSKSIPVLKEHIESF